MATKKIDTLSGLRNMYIKECALCGENLTGGDFFIDEDNPVSTERIEEEIGTSYNKSYYIFCSEKCLDIWLLKR